MQDEDDFGYTGSEWQPIEMRRATEPTEEEAELNRIPRQEECNPESWLNGNKREGDRVGMACAGCGWYPATCVVILSGEGLLPEPDWPFDYKTCPLCALREERDALKYSSRDPLTERAERLAAARKDKKWISTLLALKNTGSKKRRIKIRPFPFSQEAQGIWKSP